MPRPEASVEKGAGIFGTTTDRIRRDIATISDFGRRAGADNETPFSRAPR
jgi:hypothetical protein